MKCLPSSGLGPRHVLDRAAAQQGAQARVVVARMPGIALQQGHSPSLTAFPRGRVFWYNTFFYIYRTIYAVRCRLTPACTFPACSHLQVPLMYGRSAGSISKVTPTYFQILKQILCHGCERQMCSCPHAACQSDRMPFAQKCSLHGRVAWSSVPRHL